LIKNKAKMARKISPTSVSSVVKKMEVDTTITFENPYSSVMVMVSNLKKDTEHTGKIFKIKVINDITNVTRVK